MTEQQGSDAQLTEAQRLEIIGQADLALAEAVEEDRRTAAQPPDGAAHRPGGYPDAP